MEKPVFQQRQLWYKNLINFLINGSKRKTGKGNFVVCMALIK